MRALITMAGVLGLALALSAPADAGILDKLKDRAKKRLVEEAIETVTDSDKEKDSGEEEEKEAQEQEPEAQEANVAVDSREPLKACKDLGLDWITPWNPKLSTLRRLPGWADYVLTISPEGAVESADVIDASGKGLRKLGGSRKVVRKLLGQKMTATGSDLQCNETLFFYKDPATGKSVVPESRCDPSLGVCIKG